MNYMCVGVCARVCLCAWMDPMVWCGGCMEGVGVDVPMCME